MQCSVFHSAKSRGLLIAPKHYKSAFVDNGFRNLNNALESFCDQKGSARPKVVVLKLAATQSAATGVDVILSCQLESNQSHKR